MVAEPVFSASSTRASGVVSSPQIRPWFRGHLADVRILAEEAAEVAPHRGHGVGKASRGESGTGVSSRWDPRAWRSPGRRPGCRGCLHGSPGPRRSPSFPSLIRHRWLQRAQRTPPSPVFSIQHGFFHDAGPLLRPPSVPWSPRWARIVPPGRTGTLTGWLSVLTR